MFMGNDKRQHAYLGKLLNTLVSKYIVVRLCVDSLEQMRCIGDRQHELVMGLIIFLTRWIKISCSKTTGDTSLPALNGITPPKK